MMIGIQKFDQKPVYKIITDGPIKNYLASSIHYQSINKSRNRSSISSIKNIPFYSISAAQIFVESRIIHPYVSIPTQRCQKISPRRIINFQLPVVQPSSTPSKPIPLFSLGLKAWLCRRRPDVEEDTPWALHPQTTSGPFH